MALHYAMCTDLKAANCFLAEDGSIKIGDMNVSKVMREGLLKVRPSPPPCPSLYLHSHAFVSPSARTFHAPAPSPPHSVRV